MAGSALQNSQSASRERKETKKRSTVWLHFAEVEESVPKRIACKYCGKEYSGNNTHNGTSTMHAHIESCRKTPHNEATRKKPQVYNQQ